ncbi:MAG TPA: LptA/OstA family protein [Candidatus Brocadiia bacterium]|nr:LptA/OstA family protein [Candidatus Brocadiia bacterium]
MRSHRLILILVIAACAAVFVGTLMRTRRNYADPDAAGNGKAGSPAVNGKGPGDGGPSQIADSIFSAEGAINNNLVTVENFSHDMISKDGSKKEGTITGESAVVDNVRKIAEVKNPKLTWQPEIGGDKRVSKPGTMTAVRAVLDQQNLTVRMFDKVRVVTQDALIEAQDMEFNLPARSLTTASALKVIRYKEKDGVYPDDPGSEQTMRMDAVGADIKDEGAKLKLISDVRVKFYEVPPEITERMLKLMESSDVKAKGIDENMEIDFRCSGPLEYTRDTKTLVMANDVVGNAPERGLFCQRLTVTLDELPPSPGRKSARMTLKQFTAEGKVVITQEQDKITGDTLNWENNLQIATLEGKPCRITRPKTELEASKINFYQKSKRTTLAGPGKVLVELPEKIAKDTKLPSASESRQAEIFWNDEMIYDDQEKRAFFSNGVRIQRGSDSLSCDSLSVTFDPKNDTLKEANGRGNVKLGFKPKDKDSLVGTGDALTWDGQRGMFILMGETGREAQIAQGSQSLKSRHIEFAEKDYTLKCVGPGFVRIQDKSDAAKGKSGGELVDINWQKEMSYQGEPIPVSRFIGDVKASRGGDELACKEMTVTFLKEKQEVDTITCSGESKIVSKGGLNPKTKSESAKKIAGKRWLLSTEKLLVRPTKGTVEIPGQGIFKTMPTAEDPANDSIQWGGSMSLDEQLGLAKFQGGVKAGISANTLDCETLTVEFAREGNLKRIFAEDKVQFTHPDEKTKELWKLNSRTVEVTFTAEGKLGFCVARERVQIEHPQNNMRCDVLELEFDPAAKTTTKGAEDFVERPPLKSGRAKGNVSVKFLGDVAREGYGDEVEWNAETEMYVLRGSPAEVRQGGNRMENPELWYDAKNQRMHAPKKDTGPGRPGRIEFTPE